jgi:AcrR family transcriptional regulator
LHDACQYSGVWNVTEDRLSKQDWVKSGLLALGSKGLDALKAVVLAKRLGVSRGSFYWHFTDVAAFHDEVLAAWEKQATLDIIDEVEGKGGDAADKLVRLAQTVFSADGRLERHIRGWAAQNKLAASAQDRVDQKRVAYVAQLLRSSGHRADEAETRARFMYLALVGQFATNRKMSLDPARVTAMVQLLIASD